ncbi:MAG: alpha/beta hydrolase family protein [Planctomycetota bacterium]
MTRATLERFDLPGAADQTIRGDVHLPAGGDPAPVVLLAHGFKGFADYGFLPLLGMRLVHSGTAVVRFSFSHCGIAGGEGGDAENFDRPDLFEHDTFGRQIEDTLALIAAIRHGTLPGGERLDGERIGMIGHSRGGVTAILTTGATDALKILVTLATPCECLHDRALREKVLAEGRAPSPSGRTGEMLYVGRDFIDDLDCAGERYDLLKLLAGYPRPFLAVHGQADETVDYHAAERLAAAHAHGPTELVIVPDAGHTFEFRHGQDGSTDAFDRVSAAVIAFVKQHLGTGAP